MTSPTVNNSLAVFLINPSVRAVMCSYEGIDPKSKAPRDTPKMFKTLDPDLKVEDLVIVPTDTRVGFTVVQVAKVDVEVDYESTETVKWIVGSIDPSQYHSILSREGEFIEAVKAADKKRRQDELKKALLANLPEDEIKALPAIDMKAGA